MIRGKNELLDLQKRRIRPPRPEERLIELGGAGVAAGKVIAIWDGDRHQPSGDPVTEEHPEGKVYSGHRINSITLEADPAAPVQWKFMNDPGVGTLLDADNLVVLFAAPAGDDDDWLDQETYGGHYWSEGPTIWAALA